MIHILLENRNSKNIKFNRDLVNMNLIAHIWRIKNKRDVSGIRKYNENRIEYRQFI